jgi:hypothetical protein
VSFLCVVVVAIQAVGQVRISSTKKLTNILLDGKTHKNDFKRDEGREQRPNDQRLCHDAYGRNSPFVNATKVRLPFCGTFPPGRGHEPFEPFDRSVVVVVVGRNDERIFR